MTQEDLPECVRSKLHPHDDIEYLVNEYLTRRGYYADLNRLKAENQSLKRELVNSDKELHKLKRSFVSYDVSANFNICLYSFAVG